jgi:hypothetical protein
MTYRQTFDVEGSGSFPYDMLRFDQCWPANEGESPKLEAYMPELRRVTLMRTVFHAGDVPTIRRWQSFTWRVIEESIDTYKK